MSLAENIAKQIQIIYSANPSNVAYEKSIAIIQREITSVMDMTYTAVVRDVRDSMKITINSMEKNFQKREKST